MMSEIDADQPVRLYTPAVRGIVLEFLQRVDDRFVPPLSSGWRHGSLDHYLDYSLADGQGRILLYHLPDEVVGFLAFRYEPSPGRLPGASIYLSNMCVTQSLMGIVLIRLFRGMLRQVARDTVGSPQRIWAKTWRDNTASARTLERMGLQHRDTIASDPAFGGCRDTLIFEASWPTFADSVLQLSASCHDSDAEESRSGRSRLRREDG